MSRVAEKEGRKEKRSSGWLTGEAKLPFPLQITPQRGYTATTQSRQRGVSIRDEPNPPSLNALDYVQEGSKTGPCPM